MSSTTDNISPAPQGATVPKPVVLPLGYIWVNGTIQIDPRQAERIREIFRQYIAGR
jgi:hypothetical protein